MLNNSKKIELFKKFTFLFKTTLLVKKQTSWLQSSGDSKNSICRPAVARACAKNPNAIKLVIEGDLLKCHNCALTELGF